MSLLAISPLDGRYSEATSDLIPCFSEYALIRFRVLVETRWLLVLSRAQNIREVRDFTPDEEAFLERIASDFNQEDAARVKQIETTTRHDVKAVEYFVKEQLAESSLSDAQEWVHFACTSEDINNLAHGLMMKGGIENVWQPLAQQLIEAVSTLAREHKATPMLARTHGQTASPTTVGKELAVFVARWQRQLRGMSTHAWTGKINGAVGNFNAHAIAYPDVDWEMLARGFVEDLGLVYNPLTTQIEPHDTLAECFHNMMRFNTVTLDFCRDMWSYISLGYFKQRLVAGEVGSSTMPHKVNPIDFENSEANLGISNAMLDHLAGKLPISRLQRDLTDSSALRNMGVGVAHSVLSLRSALRGLAKVSVDEAVLNRDLDNAWEVLGEAIQTVMRKAGHENPYEQLIELTRGAAMSQTTIRTFIESLELPSEDKARLIKLTPQSYIGLAPQLVRHID